MSLENINQEIDETLYSDNSRRLVKTLNRKNTIGHSSLWHRLGERIDKKTLIVIASCVVAIAILSGTGLYFLRYRHHNNAVVSVPEKSSETGDTASTYPSLLNGTYTDNISANRHPLAVMVDNDVDARPQSGLDKADLIYETLAEGGITRFMAIFETTQSDKIGPVRSVRSYFVDWAHGYNAFIAHVGGSSDALQKISTEKSLDLDQMVFPNPYWREYTNGLAIEHTMYASTSALWDQAVANKYPSSNNFNTIQFKDEINADFEQSPSSQRININFSTPTYNAYFDYDKATNSYLRSENGMAQIDNLTKKQLSAKNVIVMRVSKSLMLDSDNPKKYKMTTTGSGKATVYMDGKIIEGTWKKGSTDDREILYDQNNVEIKYNRGKIWICVVSPDTKITVQ